MCSSQDGAYLKHLMDFNVVPIITWSVHGGVLSANEAFLDLIGYSLGDMEAGRINWRALTPPEYLPLDEHCLQQLQSSALATPYVKEYVRKDGSRVAVQLFNGRNPEDHGQGVAMILEL